MLATPVETAILKRVIGPERGGMAPSAAKELLKLDFQESDHARMAKLSKKARQGTLTPRESEELDSYINIGYFITFIQAKATTSLKSQARRPPTASQRHIESNE